MLSRIFKISTLQSLTGKYRGLQGNPCNEKRNLTMKADVPCNENRFSLWEVAHKKFPVSYTGVRFAVWLDFSIILPSPEDNSMVPTVAPVVTKIHKRTIVAYLKLHKAEHVSPPPPTA